MELNLDFLKDGARIFCATHEESNTMLQVFEKAGLIWLDTMDRPTERDYWDDNRPGITYGIYKRPHLHGEFRISQDIGHCSKSEVYVPAEVIIEEGTEFEVAGDKELLGFLCSEKG